MPDQSQLMALHERLVAGDGRAAHRIFEVAILPLIGIVGKQVTLTDRQDVEQACLDAFLKYLQRPGDYDPRRAQLLTYLAMIAKGHAMTTLRSNVRRLVRDGRYVAAEAIGGGPADEAVVEIDLTSLDPALRLQLVKEAGDDAILELIARGENELPAVAQALELPDDKHGRAEAKKRLERMRGRLRRVLEKAGE